MSLKKYKTKRDFNVTREPKKNKDVKSTKSSANDTLLYVIQKHASRHLHYDFRLQMNQVLKSWAIPKGPSLDPNIKRLAVEVEDHPLEYGSFEGTIPAHQYGAGTVILWDTGTWKCETKPNQAYRKGDITFQLHGKKLQGLWKLVRIKTKDSEDNYWLLFKLKDHYAKKNYDVLKKESSSVVNTENLMENKKMSHFIEKPFPKKFSPQLATLTDTVPSGNDWLHEIKLDGYRIICLINDKSIKLLTRNGQDWTSKFPSIVNQLKKIPLKSAILDGELVALDEKGISSFQAFQNILKTRKKNKLKYYVFDIPYYNDCDLAHAALIDRKELLYTLFQKWKKAHSNILYTDHIEGHGKITFKKACQLSLEGTISKKNSSFYEQKRTKTWLKNKCVHRQEFVIGGFTKPQGSQKYFGSLLLGYYNKQKQLIYCGHVGTGFNEKTLHDLYQTLTKLIQKKTAFYKLPKPRKVDKLHDILWVKPNLVCELSFLGWTEEGVLRHSSFLGMRKDKKASEIDKEESLTTKTSVNAIQQKNRSVVISGTRITHADRIFSQTKNITKQALANYYDTISDYILPHIINRPLLILRCPSGSKKGSFFQKHYTKAFPKQIQLIKIEKANGQEKMGFLMIKDKKGLMSLIQLDVLEIHPWGSLKNHLETPDRITFDLDPGPSVEWKDIIQAALLIRKELTKLGLKSFVKTSGSKGLHIMLPIVPHYNWADIKSFAQAFAMHVAQKYPDQFTATVVKSKRTGKIFIDYLRNVRGATSVAAYSTRAREGAPISTPVSWEELLTLQASTEFNLSNFSNRLTRLKSDPWEGFFTAKNLILPLNK